MAENDQILDKAGSYVSDLLTEKLPNKYLYHNLRHTQDVVMASKEISKELRLSEADTEIVALAAWLHDAGYTEKYEGHEEVSVEITREFLSKHNYPEDKIQKVVDCVHATKYPPKPNNQLEQVICDADLSNLGKKSYFNTSDLLRLEWESSIGKIYTEQEWVKVELDFLDGHKFFTTAAQELYNKQKSKNLTKLKKQELKLGNKNHKLEFKLEEKRRKLQDKIEKQNIPSRGIETMFRTTLRNHITLSDMADNKGNIMLSVNALILSVVFSFLVPRFDENAKLILPTLVLVLVCLTTIVFAVLSIKPKVTKGVFTKDDIEHKRSNLLFFGNFYNMSLEDFKWGMGEMMKDKDFLYGSMIKDFYFLGKVLARKYHYLRICYNIFMYGLILAVIAFALSFAID